MNPGKRICLPSLMFKSVKGQILQKIPIGVLKLKINPRIFQAHLLSIFTKEYLGYQLAVKSFGQESIPGGSTKNWRIPCFLLEEFCSPARSQANYETCRKDTQDMPKLSKTTWFSKPFWGTLPRYPKIKSDSSLFLFSFSRLCCWVCHVFHPPETTTAAKIHPARKTLHWLNHHKGHDCRFLTSRNCAAIGMVFEHWLTLQGTRKHIPPWKKGNTSAQKWRGNGYASFREGILYWNVHHINWVVWWSVHQKYGEPYGNPAPLCSLLGQIVQTEKDPEVPSLNVVDFEIFTWESTHEEVKVLSFSQMNCEMVVQYTNKHQTNIKQISWEEITHPPKCTFPYPYPVYQETS